MVFHKFLVEMLWRVIPVFAVEQGQHLHNCIGWNTVVGQLATATVIQTFCAIRFKAVFPTPDSAHGYTQYLGGLLLRQLVCGSPRIHIFELHKSNFL